MEKLGNLIQDVRENKLEALSLEAKNELIEIAREILNSDDYVELTKFLRAEFKVDISQDDIVKYLEPLTYMEERKLIHELYGH